MRKWTIHKLDEICFICWWSNPFLYFLIHEQAYDKLLVMVITYLIYYTTLIYYNYLCYKLWNTLWLKQYLMRYLPVIYFQVEWNCIPCHLRYASTSRYSRAHSTWILWLLYIKLLTTIFFICDYFRISATNVWLIWCITLSANTQNICLCLKCTDKWIDLSHFLLSS